jgi:hypothetical protein
MCTKPVDVGVELRHMHAMTFVVVRVLFQHGVPR